MKSRLNRFVFTSVTCTVLIVGIVLGRVTAPESTQHSTRPSVNQSEDTAASTRTGGHDATVEDVLALLHPERIEIARALTNIELQWHPGHTAMLLETLQFVRNPMAFEGAIDLLQRKTGYEFGDDLSAWYRAIWNEPYQPHPQYVSFKAALYRQLDPRFEEYFLEDAKAAIRLDEIRWGGVRRDGIPPLQNPETLSADAATYLAASDIIFGIEVNGEARAYPKRILAWHEMVKDVVGGMSINGVYCTLCGSMIVYRTMTADGTHYELGTSGFLYRSNKLMYDHDTRSLWSTIEGSPVVGSLVDRGIALEPLAVVTTTWGAWKAEHPETRVLSSNTGYHRDYGEGVAYFDYFATDDLMFDVPKVDDRLQNKDEVFIVRVAQIEPEPPLAISVDFLRRRPIYYDTIGEVEFVVLTDVGGANRAFESGGVSFSEMTDSGNVLDNNGMEWTANEDALISHDGTTRLSRLPGHRVFWFGWYAAHPHTRLVE